MIFDSRQQLKQYDKSNMLKSLEEIYLQCQQVINDFNKIRIPSNYKKVKKIVVSGMGGSNLGARMIKSLFFREFKVPFIICHDYNLPAIVDKETLFISSSYSGETEETIYSLKQAIEMGAKIFVITSGGKLEKIAKNEKLPNYKIIPLHNSCGQPRTALGYNIFAQFMIFRNLGLINFSFKQVQEIIRLLKRCNKLYGPEKKEENNLAKKIALSLENKIPIFVGAEFLTANLHIMRNQLNESSKTFSSYLTIPELNHYALEGLKYPKSSKKNLKFVFFNSQFYFFKNQFRIKITEKVLSKLGVPYLEYNLKEKNKLLQSFKLLSLSSWFSYYLSILHRINPSSIRYVDYFKKELRNI